MGWFSDGLSDRLTDPFAARPPGTAERRPERPKADPAGPKRMGRPATPRGLAKPTPGAFRRVNVGLDFGTSTTKVIVGIDQPGGQPLYLVVGPRGEAGTVLFPSTVAVDDGRLLFGHAAERSASSITARSFKMNLPAEVGGKSHPWQGPLKLGDTGLSAEQVSTLFLAWVLRQVVEQVSAFLNGAEVRLTVNAAAPLDQMTGNPPLRDAIHRIVFNALSIRNRARQPWPLDDVEELLTDAAHWPPVPTTVGESPVGVYPETHAAVTAYMLQPDRAARTYATVDVGAGSTDVAFFWFHPNAAGQPTMWYYGACSGFVGMDDVDRAMGTRLGVDLDVARRLRIDGAVKLADYADTLQGVLRQIHDCYRKAFGKSYEANPGQRQWQERNGLAKYMLWLVGGGAMCDPLAQRLGQPLDKLAMTDVESDVMRVPHDLHVVGTDTPRPRRIAEVAPQEQPLLLLAHGLAHRAVDIPQYETDQTHHVVRVLEERPTHEDLYAK